MTLFEQDQDDVEEEEVLLDSMASQMEMVSRLMQSHPTLSWLFKMVWREETFIFLISLVILGILITRFDKHTRVFGWFNFFHHFHEALPCSSQDSEWSELGSHSAVFSMQGRRPGNEDRAVIKRVEMVEGVDDDEEAVHIWAVMDGHGGEFCVDYATTHLLAGLEKSVQKLKILTSKLDKTEKLKLYEKHFLGASAAILRYLDISDSEYETLKETKSLTEDIADIDAEKNLVEEVKLDDNVTQPLASRMSNQIEDIPSIPEIEIPTPPKFTPRAKKGTERKLLKEKKELSCSDIEITDYIKNGEILYPKLIKEEVNKVDKEMLVEAKKANAIGGTTLILALLDAGQLWVGNVGDSRAVFGHDSGQAVPMSYDHKPCQLKEKKRIQEAGGYVSMNGVWRVMGVLATSRALGDYPLKDKNVVVSDPDVLSFSLKDHRMQFAVLASDGLWDTHTNEEAVYTIKARLDKERLMGAETLAREAFSRGSLDNVTVLVIDLNSFKK